MGVSAGNLGLVSQLIGMGATVGNTLAQSRAARTQANYDASVADQNARMSAFQAEDALRRGETETNRARMATKRLIGSQRAAMAAQGIEVDSGSAMDIQEDTAALGALDAQAIQNNAYMEAFGYKSQAIDYTAKAKMSKLEGRTKARNSLLTGGLQFARDLTGAVDYGQRNRLFEI